MAKIFEHPMTLFFTVGKNLIVNGINILHEIEYAIKFYEKGDFYNFGVQIGTALDELFLKAPYTKDEADY